MLRRITTAVLILTLTSTAAEAGESGFPRPDALTREFVRALNEIKDKSPKPLLRFFVSAAEYKALQAQREDLREQSWADARDEFLECCRRDAAKDGTFPENGTLELAGTDLNGKMPLLLDAGYRYGWSVRTFAGLQRKTAKLSFEILAKTATGWKIGRFQTGTRTLAQRAALAWLDREGATYAAMKGVLGVGLGRGAGAADPKGDWCIVLTVRGGAMAGEWPATVKSRGITLPVRVERVATKPKAEAGEEVEPLETRPESGKPARRKIELIEEEPPAASKPDSQDAKDAKGKAAPGSAPKTAPKSELKLEAVPEAWRGRFSARAAAAEGATPGTRKAVKDALDWLARHQREDGRWVNHGWKKACAEQGCADTGRDDGTAMLSVGVHAIALLAFLGDGHTPEHGEHRAVVAKGLESLLKLQRPNGAFGDVDRETIYNQAFATRAVIEAAALTAGKDLRKRLYEAGERGLKLCVTAQNPGLGWKYGIKPGQNDSSVTVAMMHALHAGKVAGMAVPPQSLQGGRAWLDRVTDSRGSVGYQTPGGGSSYLVANKGLFREMPLNTAAALGCLPLLFKDRRGRQKGHRLLLSELPSSGDGGRRINFYYWHHGTDALFQLGGEAWRRWDKALKTALLPTRNTKGCDRGSWNPDGEWCLAGGRVYATAINALTLETYGREARVK